MGHDLKYAAGNLLRLRGATAVAVAALAIGIAAVTTMFAVVYGALWRPLPFAEPERLAILYNTRLTPRDGLQQLRWSRPLVTDLQQSVHAFEFLASFTSASVSISGAGDPEQVEAEVVSPSYFLALRIVPKAGRLFRADEDQAAGQSPAAVVSDGLWQRYFGQAPLAQQTIRINGVALPIVGVAPAGFAGMSGRAVAWITPSTAAALTYADYLTTRQHFITVLGRLAAGVDFRAASAELAVVGSRFRDDGSPATTTWGAVAVPLRDARIDTSHRQAVWLMFGASIGMLLIVCVNVASLLLARAWTRRREVAVRLALGAGRRRLIRQFLTEGLLLATVAGAAGLLLTPPAMALYTREAPHILPTAANNYATVSAFGMPALDAVVLAAALAAILGTTIVFALAPAIRLSRSNLTDDLRSGHRAGSPHARGLSRLATAQVAIAVLLLCISGMLVGAVAELQQRRVGYDPERVLTFWVRPPVSRYNYPQDGPAIISRLLASVQAVGGVESAAINRCVPFGGCSRSTVLFPDRASDRAQGPVVGRHYVSPDYFRTLGIRLASGRTLTEADRAGAAPVTVVSETAARRFWPGESAVGKRVLFGNAGTPFSDPSRPVEVVGIVGDVKYEGADQPDAEMRGEFYTSYLQFSYPDTMVIVKARSEAGALVGPLRRAVAAVDESLPIFDVLTLDERIDASLDRPRFTMALLTGFGVTSLLLAALGMYGVLSSAVSARLRELGVRIALGASRRQIVGMVLGQGLQSAFWGLAAGVFGAWLMTGVLRLVAVEGTLLQWPLLGGVFALTCGACAIAAYLPARRAAAADPIVVLRAE